MNADSQEKLRGRMVAGGMAYVVKVQHADVVRGSSLLAICDFEVFCEMCTIVGAATIFGKLEGVKSLET